jgi:hypothetical protein
MGAGMLGQLANLGGVQRGIGAEQQGFDLARWQAQQPWQDPGLNFLSTALGVPAFTNVGFQGVRQPSPMESILPAMGQWAGAGFPSMPGK